MSYSHTIKQALKEFNETHYLVIEIKIVSTDRKFEHRANPIFISVTDSTHAATSFLTHISGNQKELIGCFNVDAFNGFSSTVTIQFSHTGNDVAFLQNVDLDIVVLPSELAAVPHQVADSAWLNSLS
jgi:hypothetical protein